MFLSFCLPLVQDILATKMEGEPKVKNVISLAQKVLPHTAPQGRDVIMRDTEALRQDWEAFIMALAKVTACMHQIIHTHTHTHTHTVLQAGLGRLYHGTR
jgi:hypothetical protein